jgi:glutamate---cysteine ligase / carboxylate-amine ligase
MPHPLFSVFGVEIEIMCVNRDDLRVWPHVDYLLSDLGGSPDSHPTFGVVEADNELAAHVVEFKLSQPSPTLAGIWRDFLGMAQSSHAALGARGALLLPGGVHPFMDPTTESRLWPYEDSPIYSAYDRIFGCQGHGWFNLQSVHLNLPFANDNEFAALHSAIALLLPLLPALSNSSPVIDGLASAWQSSRLQQYAGNQRKVASISGHLIPEAVASEAEYRDVILAPMYRDMQPLDPEGLLQDEWLNSRAAIARFDRNAIEIRCLDAQETPRADVALCWAAASLLRHMIHTTGGPALLAAHRAQSLPELRKLFEATARTGRLTPLPESYPWKIFGLSPQDFSGGRPKTVGELWAKAIAKACAENALAGETEYRDVIEVILQQGSLAERILANAPQPRPQGNGWVTVYRPLGDCLLNDRLFGVTGR